MLKQKHTDILELSNTIIEKKNALESIGNRAYDKEESISELEVTNLEMITGRRGKRIKTFLKNEIL